MQIKMLCLANSKKPPTGRCVAGKELINGAVGKWIRPVSDRLGKEVSEDERRYEDGATAQVGHKISLVLSVAAPHLHQQENVIIDAKCGWQKDGVASWQELLDATDNHNGQLWVNGWSTNHGDNDKVPEAQLPGVGRSLFFLAVQSLTLRVWLMPGYEGSQARRKVRAVFQYAGSDYDISVSDPLIESEMLARPNGNYLAGPVLVCVSLAEPFHGYAFKVAASIINQRRVSGQTLLP